MPTKLAKSMATVAVSGAISVGQPANVLMMMDTPQPSAIPSAPPSMESSTASIRNCQRISRSCAPTDMRMPISRVRW